MKLQSEPQLELLSSIADNSDNRQHDVKLGFSLADFIFGFLGEVFLRNTTTTSYPQYIIFNFRVFLRLRESNYPLNSEIKSKTMYCFLKFRCRDFSWKFLNFF